MPRFRVEVRGTYSQGRYVEAATAAEARRMIANGEDGGVDCDQDDIMYERRAPGSWRVDPAPSE